MALFNRPPLTVSLYKPVVAPHGVSLLLAHHQSSMGIPYVESGGEGAVCIASRSTGEATPCEGIHSRFRFNFSPLSPKNQVSACSTLGTTTVVCGMT